MGETEGTAGGGRHGHIQSCLLSPWITLTGKEGNNSWLNVANNTLTFQPAYRPCYTCM